MENPQSKSTTSAQSQLISTRLESLRNQQPFSLEVVGEINGITLVNDSAATTLDLVASSLLAFEKPVVWIVEANTVNDDMHMLREVVKQKVKTIVAIGSCTDELHRALWPAIGFFISASSWEEVLDMGLIAALSGDALLFSPGCRASEPFKNYRERGAYMNQLIEIKRNTKP
jgi:UDP-N-acetylmuramoylalanine--D-glutamate ligase